MMYRIYRRLSEAMEVCFNVAAIEALTGRELVVLFEMIQQTFEPELTSEGSFLSAKKGEAGQILEIGPRMAFETPYSSNAVGICRAVGIEKIVRIEPSIRYLCADDEARRKILETKFDRMTQAIYPDGITTFDSGVLPEPVRIIPVMEEGIEALREVNKELGLGMDVEDSKYNFHLFTEVFHRNPTDVELFQMGNANSEHCRHWFFRGIQIIDGSRIPSSLLDLVRLPLGVIQLDNPDSNVSLAAFNDNSGVIQGNWATVLIPDFENRALMVQVRRLIHFTATAETHNHPTAVAPDPGAQTGAGGRIRDNVATGRGAKVGMADAGYFVGNLFIPGHLIPGEREETRRKVPYATALQILTQGSNGVSTYGNQIGEPLTQGFCRTFGQMVAGELRQPFKPILYSGGTGFIFDGQVKKAEPEKGMIIVAIGGPALPVGEGGGSASSMVHGTSTAVLDYKSVQRGNAEMEQRVNRAIAACSEMGDKNPIAVIHDQGAGGPSNVLSELMGKAGGRLDINKINVGDKTMSRRKIWSAEFQERYGLLIYPDRLELFIQICKDERVPCEVLGEITGDGKIVVSDSSNGTTPVNLDLEAILGDLPQKKWESRHLKHKLPALEIPEDLTVAKALEMVCKLPAVGSKSHLVNKVDNHVGGNIIQQQRCGIMQIPISDYSLCATGYWDKGGVVSTLGENPNRILINPAAGVRMAVAEALSNMAGVKIRDISAIRARANWMWPAKLPFEGALLYDGVKAMSDFLIDLGFAICGGKDSLSIATVIGDETVKAPGALVFKAYAAVPDFDVRVTPEIKKPGESLLGLIDLGLGKNRMGGSALAQALGQLGNESPDIDAELFKAALQTIQQLVEEKLLLSLHDRSDGGLIITVAEMCMASNCGFHIFAKSVASVIPELFCEECGWVAEFDPDKLQRIQEICSLNGIQFERLGHTISGNYCGVEAPYISVRYISKIEKIRAQWETTSLALEKQQNTLSCVESERDAVSQVTTIGPVNHPAYRLTFVPQRTPKEIVDSADKPSMAVIREEGTNGDAEMRALFQTAGFKVYDFAMTYLLSGRVSLDDVQMVAFAGGFSYMDVLGSGVGWSAVIRNNEKLSAMFDRFYNRRDTLSLGVCNGCQLMALLGWVPHKDLARKLQPRFIENLSGKFESRPVQVEVLQSPAVMLSGMEGSRLFVWTAHGEGRAFFPDKAIHEDVRNQKLVPLAYIDPLGSITEKYPYNPNGSPDGIAGLCSPDGRHLAMMPHPERCFLMSRWPWKPHAWKTSEDDVAPWLRMVQNARDWCAKNK